MCKKILGTHNSMSYLKPDKWWMNLFNIFAKCQNKNIDEQFEHGAKCIDLRVYFDNREWYFAHGLINYKKDVNLKHILDYISFRVKELPIQDCYIRIILEKGKHFKEFNELCSNLPDLYPNMIFIGGYSKKNWESIYPFLANTNINITQHVSSMAKDANFIERCIPILYAKKHRNIVMENGINLVDFI